VELIAEGRSHQRSRLANFATAWVPTWRIYYAVAIGAIGNRYYGVPMNDHALHLFRIQVGRLWHRALLRRSQTSRISWDRMHRLIAAGCLPFASTILILSAAWVLSPKVRAGCGKAACPDPWRGL
jgi:hypothetical protein